MSHSNYTDDERHAAQIALTKKPLGKQARAFYSYIEKLVSECDALTEIEGQTARDRQISVGHEIAQYRFPAIANIDEYNIAQDAGMWQYKADFNGEYYPEEQQEADNRETNEP